MDKNSSSTISQNFLGIYIDNKLNWSEHIKQTLIKLNRNIGIMYNVRNSLTKNTKLLLYYSMIHCHLHYGNIIWGSAYASSLRPVITAQKKAVRIISGIPFREHTNPYFKSLKILKFNDINYLSVSKFVHKQLQLINPLIPFVAANTVHNHNTRNRIRPRPPRPRSNLSKAFIRY